MRTSGWSTGCHAGAMETTPSRLRLQTVVKSAASPSNISDVVQFAPVTSRLSSRVLHSLNGLSVRSVPSRRSTSKMTSAARTCRSSGHADRRAGIRLTFTPCDELAIEAGIRWQRPELGEQWSHVPAAAAPNAESVLCRNDRPEPVPLEIEGPPRAGGQRPGARKHRVGQLSRSRRMHDPNDLRALHPNSTRTRRRCRACLSVPPSPSAAAGPRSRQRTTTRRRPRSRCAGAAATPEPQRTHSRPDM
jgi:hypothetical protein